MIKELIKLANILDSKGLTKEADYVDGMINKFAQNWLETAAHYWADRLAGPKAEGSDSHIQHAIDFWTKNNWTKEDILAGAKGYYDYATSVPDELTKDIKEADRLLKERIEETSPFKDNSGAAARGLAAGVSAATPKPVPIPLTPEEKYRQEANRRYYAGTVDRWYSGD